MADFKSEPRQIHASAEAVFDKLSNLGAFGEILASVPESAVPAEQREMLDKVVITDNSVSFPAGPVGDITMVMERKERPTLIEMVGKDTPVALSMRLEIAPLGEECETAVVIDVAIPPMLKPMVSGPLQKMADQFADVIERLKYAE